ncbi:hypothetical protein BD324DRAFT_638071 [Kockovaella imperatae]|uniref:Uncharacterized protein n=1 Tax=Kockovaella imperatae TaxID=4999 RepID=A0A1Y1U910_9TREE|nr:hypothetical protein BD324DRAFT_638071 [Kockovaella imperatae]ORX34024.1 hypothetical protein BD324DRAFT_638071 [Kockovaella imperatae]
MGVRGLATFIKDNRQSLCSYRQFSEDVAGPSSRIPIVIDAWGLVFQLYLSCLPWASGGEYLRFSRLIKRFVDAWRKVGLEPVIVFDGTAPSAKHATIISRLERSFTISALFYTTSVESRSRPSFSRSEAILPPLALHTFIHTVESLKVKTHFTPFGEADGIIVAIANDLGGYVLGQDSDFLIFMAGPGAENVRGYCPLDFVEWRDKSPPSTPKVDAEEWTVASSKKALGSHRQTPLLPPSNAVSPILTLGVVSATAFRQRFRLPPSHFALLASIVGNDYTPQHFSNKLFASRYNAGKGSEKIELVARIIREAHFGPSAVKERQASAGDQAVFLITKVIGRLCSESGLHTHQSTISDMVNTIIDATLQYVLPSTVACCEAYPFCGQTSHTGCRSEQSISAAQKAYAHAQQVGRIASVVNWYLSPDRLYLLTGLEDPSEPSYANTDRNRNIRQRAYRIVEHGLGDFCWPDPTEAEIAAVKEDRAARELLIVDAEDESSGSETDLSLDAKPASEGQTMVDDEHDAKDLLDGEAVDVVVPPSRTLTEYTRQGSTFKLVGQQVPLPPRPEGRPDALHPLDFRIQRFLELIECASPKISGLPRQYHPLAVSIRLCVLDAYDRSGIKGSGSWRRSEVEAVLRACIGTFAGWQRDSKVDRSKHDSDEGQYPVLETRSSKIVGQLTVAMSVCHWLAQALLLVPDADCATPLTHLTPFMFLSGVALHSCLAKVDPPPSTGWLWSVKEDVVYGQCLDAVLHDLDDKIIGHTPAVESENVPELEIELGALSIDSGGSRRKKKTKNKPKKSGTASQGMQRTAPTSGTRFDLLMDSATATAAALID